MGQRFLSAWVNLVSAPTDRSPKAHHGHGGHARRRAFPGLKTPRLAMVFGGLAGTVSDASAGLAATDRKPVLYGTLVATFYTGLGCPMGPSVLLFAAKALVS